MVKLVLVDWIYLSPHLDDIALSCGGLLWEQSQAGDKVSVWTVCAGDPPPGVVTPFAESLHERWETPQEAWKRRREEDRLSCSRLGAEALHLDIPDCIYRLGGDPPVPLYDSEESLWGEVHPAEMGLVDRLVSELARRLPGEASAYQAGAYQAGAFQLVCPWTLGGHVDHRLTRLAAERLVRAGRAPWLWFYGDYPYILQDDTAPGRIEQAGYLEQVFPISEVGLAAWQDAVAAHATQISTFWPNLEAMRAALRSFLESAGGVRLWKPAGG